MSNQQSDWELLKFHSKKTAQAIGIFNKGQSNPNSFGEESCRICGFAPMSFIEAAEAYAAEQVKAARLADLERIEKSFPIITEEQYDQFDNPYEVNLTRQALADEIAAIRKEIEAP